MENKTASESFYAKISGEYDVFIDRLKTKTPDEILVAAYEKVSKEELVIAFENSFYSDDEYAALMKHDNLLDELYMDWLDTDSADMEQIGTLISDLVERDMEGDGTSHDDSEWHDLADREEPDEGGDYSFEERIAADFATKTSATTETINGAVSYGNWVIAVTEKPYASLIGQVIAIDKVGTDEHDTDNSGDDVHVDFTRVDYQPDEVLAIEANFAKLYGGHKPYGELPLDDVIMSPKMLVSLTGRDIEPTNELTESYGDAKEFANARLSMNFDNLEDALIERVKQNYEDYQKSLLSFGKREIIDMADKISAMSDAHDYLTLYHTFSDDELRFFIQFQNPLEVVGEDWQKRNSDLDEMSFTMDYIGERREFLLTQYALIKDVPTLSEPPQEVHKPQEQTPPAPAKRVLPPVKPEPPKKQSLNSLLDSAIEEVKEINAAREPQKQKSHKKELE
jgi:hypothetical protein